MIKEKGFEDILCKYPELIELGLVFKGRQIHVYGRRMDILFEDKFNRTLIVELKVGPIKDEHIGQILSYEGILLSADDPSMRVMLIGNRVPPNIQKSLDHHGIAWKEITFSYLRDFLRKKDDAEMLGFFEGQDIVEEVVKQTSIEARRSLPAAEQTLDKIYSLAQRVANAGGGGKYLYCPEEDKFYSYKDGLWKSVFNIELKIEEDVPEVRRYPIAVRRKILENLKPLTLKPLAEFNCSGYLNFMNGLVEPLKGNIEPYAPDIITTMRLPYDYDEKALCPLWEKILNEMLQNDQDKIRTIQEFFGYCLSRDARFKKALVLVGKSSTGKSVIIDTLRHMLGDNNCSNVPLRNFSNPHLVTSMVNKFVNTIYDSQKYIEKHEAKFMSAISGAEILLRKKYAEQFKFRPYCKFIVEASIPPHLFKPSPELHKYLLPVNCERIFSYKEQNNKLKDHLLMELPGVLNWAIVGLKRLNERGMSEEVDFLKDAASELKEENNPTEIFFKEHVETKFESEIEKGVLYEHYRTWCRNNQPDGYVISAVKFSQCVYHKYSKFTPKNVQSNQHKRVWKNLRFVENKGVEPTQQPDTAKQAD